MKKINKAQGVSTGCRSFLICLLVVSSTLTLSGCITDQVLVSQQTNPDIKPPKSLVPQPPPGGFQSVIPKVASKPQASSPTPSYSPPKVVSSGIGQDTVPAVRAIEESSALIREPVAAVISDKAVAGGKNGGALSWISQFPALAKEYEEYKDTLSELEQAYKQYEEKVQQLRQKASRYWGGDNVHESGSDKYVKYGKGYTSRGEVDFAKGNIVVETVEAQNHKQRLQEAIVTTLLTPDDARDPELFSDQGVTYRGPSVLEGQVKDHEGVIVKWEWRANRYADWLVANKLQKVSTGGKTIYRIEIPMEANHQQVRGQKYEALVRKSAQQYGVSESLIYSIMETESHFNPYATSHIPAYGLMQVVPSTAGRDVFQRIKKRNDQPTRSYLFNPTNNIDTGAAYLSILDDIYLKDVKHPLAREYCVISAYNGGAGNVLRTFSRDRKHAVQVINSLTPQQVYVKLNRSHPSAESRKYIEKVVKAKQKYDGMAVAMVP